jgi:hypothetical protein
MPKLCFITSPCCFFGTDYYSYIFLNLSEVKPRDVMSGYPHTHPLLLTKAVVHHAFLPSSAHDCLFVCLFVWLVGLFVCLFIHPSIINSSLTKYIVLMTLLLVLLHELCLVLLIWITNQQSVQLKTCPCPCMVEQFQIPGSHHNTCCWKKAYETHTWNPLDEPAPTPGTIKIASKYYIFKKTKSGSLSIDYNIFVENFVNFFFKKYFSVKFSLFLWKIVKFFFLNFVIIDLQYARVISTHLYHGNEPVLCILDFYEEPPVPVLLKNGLVLGNPVQN